jgi:lipid-binding SYLF domain-containing protein
MKIARYAVLMLSLAMATLAHADAVQDTIANFKKSEVANKYFATAYGYAVFPTIGKGGLVVGGGGGKGRVYRGGQVTGESTMVQLSVGFQMGGQAYSQIIFFEDQRAYDEFTTTGFEFGAGASAVAITAGAQAHAGTAGAAASAGTEASKTKAKGMAVLTLAKGGLMYEAALAGQKYNFKPT